MQKTCAQCRQGFELTDGDLEFYDKVSPVFGGKKPALPPPTLCADCRVQRRMAWRNDRTFYHRKCSLSGRQVVSIYPPETPFPVYHQSEWYGDKWNPMTYGLPFDAGRPFLDQWRDLMRAVPRLGMDLVNCENSDYCNYCGDDKNCYLDIAGEANEDCYFCLFTKYSKNCIDCTFAYRCTLCHESIQCYDSYALRNCQYMDGCSGCAFCFDCKGCKDCILCVNLRNKQYCILNEQLTKDEYERRKSELRMDSTDAVKNVAAIWKDMRIKRGVYCDMYNLSSENCQGNDIKNSKNCLQCFNASGCEDCASLYDVLDAKDCRDLNYSLYNPELSYELISTLAMRGSAFCMASHYCSSALYCDLCNNSQDLFGCIGLNRKQYCILNTQYTKDEYEALVPKIIESMRADGAWGEFFPVALSPFGYNETVAPEYMPLEEKNVQKRGWTWKDDPDGKRYSGPSVSVPASIGDTDDSICGKVLVCEASDRPYKIIPQELEFYRTAGIPVPRRSPEQRHLDRNALRNPRRLWDRTCATCAKAIRTTYAPDRPETVHCEECYLKAVY